MANSKYEYVRNFEQPDALLPNTWIVVRIDGRGFHRFSNRHGFKKPNDARALELMNEAARAVLRDIQDVIVAYGVSDEYSFVFHRNTTLFERRASKLSSTIVSTFTAAYCLLWQQFFPEGPLLSIFENVTTPEEEHGQSANVSSESLGLLPTFDARAVAYPSLQNLRDYLSWRQVDCHINNLYNTAFWALVQQGGLSNRDAEQELSGTVAAEKNEILFSRFGVNYNNEPEMFRKGSIVFRALSCGNSDQSQRQMRRSGDVSENRYKEAVETVTDTSMSKTAQMREARQKRKAKVVVQHVDIIGEEFWEKRPWILQGRAPYQS